MTEMDKKTANDIKANGEAHAMPSQLEELFSEAEEKGFSDYKYKPVEPEPEPDPELVATSGEPTTELPFCQHDDTLPEERNWCENCRKLTCPKCRASIDPTYCDQCFQYQEKPLIDQDGVTHQGRELLVYGPTFSGTAARIGQMNQADLEVFIRKYKLLIKQAEIGLEFKRVTLGMAEMHGRDLKDAERRRRRADKTPIGASKKVSISKPKGVKAPAAPAMSFAQQMAAVTKLMQQMKVKSQPNANTIPNKENK